MFIVMGCFAALIGLMPVGFYQNQIGYVTPTTQDQTVVDYFSANNITVYSVSWSGTLTFPNVIANQSGLPDGHSIEIHWENAAVNNWFTGQIEANVPAIFFRHVFPGSILWVIPTPWPDYESMNIKETPSGWYSYLNRAEFLSFSNNNTVRLSASCSHASINAVFLPKNSTTTLEQSWDAGEMKVLVSYGIDWDSMKPSAWGLITQLVTFQKPSLGIPGDFGSFISYAFGLGFWITIAIIVYTIVTRLIPTLQGGVEG